MKKTIAILLSVFLLIGLVPAASAAEIVDSGMCGDNLTWTLDSDGLLTISGTGDMFNYELIDTWVEDENALDGWRMDVITGAPWGHARFTHVSVRTGVTSIGANAFKGLDKIVSLEIGRDVTKIGFSAFMGCGLTSLTIPNSVTSIENFAFAYCHSLASVTIPDSVTNIEDSAFCWCEHLTSITIGNGVTNIGNKAFYNCSSLTSITIPDGVTSIGDDTFYSCSSLTSITIPDSVTNIGNTAFYYCSKLASVTIPDGVTNIGNNAFNYCAKLTNLTIPDGVTSIGNGTFCDCHSLTSITIPDSVTSIGDFAFAHCSKLTSVTIPDGVTSIAYFAFYDCQSLTNITIPDSVTSIVACAFSCCYSLTSITIPDSVTSIGATAFHKCYNLTSVKIPVSVNYVYSRAFAGCSTLEAVYFYNPNCTIEEQSFPTSTTIYGYTSSTAQTFAEENNLTFVPLDPHEHSYVEEVLLSPTCTEAGEAQYTCSCGDTYTDTLPALGHDYIDHPAKAPTCIAVGWDAYRTCSRCNYTSYQEIGVDADNHVNTEDAPESSSTCVVPGYMAGVYCNDCKRYISGHTEKAPADHTWNAGETLKEANCKEKGSVKYTCTVEGCGATKTAETEIAPDNHNYASVITAPTCTAQGYTTYTCTRCDNTYNAAYTAALGHSYTAVVTPATCTAAGYTTYMCVRGDHSYTADYTEPLQHIDKNGDGKCDYGCGTVMTQPEPGDSGNKCPYCGQVHPNNFMGSMISFFHNIAYIFARMFGTR